MSHSVPVSRRKIPEVIHPIASGNTYVEEHFLVKTNFHRQLSSTEAFPDKACIPVLLVSNRYQLESDSITSNLSSFVVLFAYFEKKSTNHRYSTV